MSVTSESVAPSMCERGNGGLPERSVADHAARTTIGWVADGYTASA